MKISKILFPLILSYFFQLGNVQSQNKVPFLLGIQPSVTIEPFYEEGELDIAVVPLVIEFPISKRMNFRILPLVNYHIGGDEPGISDIGIFSVLPIFFKRKENVEELPYGFYIGPVLGFGRNLINEHYTMTLATEPGYLFETKKSFTIALGMQLGGSYFNYDNEANKWVLHWGPKVTFGFWLNKP